MGSLGSGAVPSDAPGVLPDRIFAVDCYPGHAVRINSYSKPKYLIDILKVLEGMPELESLLASPLGALFSLPVRQFSLSGQLVHQMLYRQLYTTNSAEMWFVFGGQPLRFSLKEFGDVTGLSCCDLPPQSELEAATSHAEGDSPYWYKLIGGKPGSVTVKELLARLKREPTMAPWRKFRICLIVIVEGILLCRSQPVKASMEVVEMVKDVDFFLKYPWGRHSFHRMLRMVKVGTYIDNTATLVGKLRQSSLAVHGFPLSIQLFAFKSIPSLLKYLPNGGEQFTFLDQIIPRLAKCKSYHTSNIMRLEYSRSLFVLLPQPPASAFVCSGHCDPKVTHLETLIASAFEFHTSIWPGGDASLPSLRSSRKRKCDASPSESSSSGEDNGQKKVKRNVRSAPVSKHKAADTLLEKKFKSFKESLLVEVRHLIENGYQPTVVAPSTVKNTPTPAVSPSPARVTRSGSVGISAHSLSNRSTSRKQADSRSAKQLASSRSGRGSRHDVLSQSCSLSTASSEACTGFCDTTADAPPPTASSPTITVNNAPTVNCSQSSTPISVLRPDNKLLTKKETRCTSLLHEAAKYTIHTSRFACKISEPASSDHRPQLTQPHVPPASALPLATSLVSPTVLDAAIPDSEKGSNFVPPIVPVSNLPLPRNSTDVLPTHLPTFVKHVSEPCPNDGSADHNTCVFSDKHHPLSSLEKTSQRKKSPASLSLAKPPKQLLLSGPAMNLRRKKHGSQAKNVIDSSTYIISTLDSVSSASIAKFVHQLSQFSGSEYAINGQPYPASFFTAIYKPKNWLSSLHIDCMVTFLWKKHGSYLASRKITVLDSMFTSIMSNRFMSFSQNLNTTAYSWNPLLIAYARGLVDGRPSQLAWLTDVDIVYLPMNWGKRHWVALAVDLPRGHIDILDPFEDCTSSRKVVSYMSPVSQMLPSLLRSVCVDVPSTWPQAGFTFNRLPNVTQNHRGGDCGPMCLKFIELHSHQLTEPLRAMTNQQVDNIRMHYAMDLYAEFVSRA